MKRLLIAIVVLTVVWVAFILTCYAGLNSVAGTVYDGCFDNSGKWYTQEHAR